MKAIIRVTRLTEYASIVEMDEEKFVSLYSALESSDGKVSREAKNVLNRLIDTSDWQDDKLWAIEEFEKL